MQVTTCLIQIWNPTSFTTAELANFAKMEISCIALELVSNAIGATQKLVKRPI